MWYRVFGMNQAPLFPADVLEFLDRKHPGVTGHFRGDDSGWFYAELTLPDSDVRIEMARYLANEEGIRREMNGWAAWIEDVLGEEKGGPWMQRLINTAQIITLRLGDEEAEIESAVDALLAILCHYLAGLSEGIYQIDGRGMFQADGEVIAVETL